ncbi:bifunctional (p)ppGpp synthetase/guanosine-3',5'-bis(diphosphate) 3'-pyrophosphohydrolase [Candidatus Micrarchaeota archaeon]|nr:bifunctional (p)ppGpp synthetase/guanosine-3',5'-bis(diphosphate) 3'-pyrophosphohydrolase [Candidatus Micrarchaeota archaeon]
MSIVLRPPSATAYPQRLELSMQRWSRTYRKFGGQDAFPHAKRVLDAAIAHNMIDLNAIENRKKDPNSLNQALANIILSHIFRRRQDNFKMFQKLDFARHPLVVEGFNTFDALRENDLTEQHTQTYAILLTTPSLGLVARMIDLTQYGADGDVSESELSHLDSKIFYMFDSKKGKTEYELIGLAAKNIYSPLADLFGYRDLAGDLQVIYYYHVDRDSYVKVERAIESIAENIEKTKLLTRSSIPLIAQALFDEGYDFDIKMRERKHPGKVMEKSERYAKKEGKTVSAVVPELHDHVAFTIILKTRDGREITKNDLDDFVRVGEIVLSVVNRAKKLRFKEIEIKDLVSVPKANGYSSYHVNMKFEDPEFIGLEAIIRNRRMEKFAEHGPAAHCLYKSSGHLPRMVLSAYTAAMAALKESNIPTLSIHDSAIHKRLHIFYNGKMITRVVDSRSTIAEVMICADIDLLQDLRITPDASLLAPAKNLDELHIEYVGERGVLTLEMINMLVKSAVYSETKEVLERYKKMLRP